jgi:hypothetical protein
MVVGDERSFVGCSDEPVVPDPGSEGEESSGDAGVDAGDGASTVVFESELALHRVEHRLDPLADAAEFAEAGFLVTAVGTDEVGAEFVGDEPLEFLPGEAFVADDDLPGSDQVFIVAEHVFGGFAFTDLRVRESPDDGHPIRCADQVKPETPEVAGVGGTISVACMTGQVRAFHCLAGLPARQRGGIDQPGDLAPGRGVSSEFGDHGGQEPGCLADSFAPTRLLGKVGEHSLQMLVGVADPFSFGCDAKQVLGDDQAEQLNIGQGRWAPGSAPSGKPQRGDDPIVKMDVKCGQEGVEVCFHTLGLTPSVLD